MVKLTKRRIFIEATVLMREQRTGVDYLAEGLLGELIRASPDVDFVLFSFAKPIEDLRLKAPNVTFKSITKMTERLYRMLLLVGIAPSVEWLLDEDKIDDCIFPNFSSWPLKSPGSRSYPFVHDTSYLDTPEYSSKRLRRFLDMTVRRSVKYANAVLVNSISTKNDVMRHYKVAESRLVVLYPAVPKPARPEPIHVPPEYILYLGTMEPRKNVTSLIRAHLALPESVRKRYPLVLAGKKGWLDEEIQDLLFANKGNYVHWLGYVTDGQRAQLWKGATIFVYPSAYEGFGMPVLEAQSNGVPVITTRSSSLPEAGGTAAYYSNSDSKSLSRSIKYLLDNLAVRNCMTTDGLKHASTFAWSKSAQKLQKLLDIK